jgi:hypothetical protein
LIHKSFNVVVDSCSVQGELPLNDQILLACKELIDDAKMGCADLVFKEICLEILSRASHVLTKRQFEQLAEYASEKMREKMSFDFQREIAMNK